LNKKEEVYDLLIGRLVNAQYVFGQKLSVRDIAGETNASRQPIMAALNRLHAEGFVRIFPQVGCEVVSPGRDQIADFYLMFERMEGLLAELAAVRRTDAQIAELRRINAQIMMLDGGSAWAQDEYATLNRAFHQTIHDMAHSPFVDDRQTRNFNMSDFFINQAGGFKPFMAESAREHEGIIDAIVTRAPDRARVLSEEHIADVSTHVLAGLGQVGS